MLTLKKYQNLCLIKMLNLFTREKKKTKCTCNVRSDTSIHIDAIDGHVVLLGLYLCLPQYVLKC